MYMCVLHFSRRNQIRDTYINVNERNTNCFCTSFEFKLFPMVERQIELTEGRYSVASNAISIFEQTC